MASNDGWFLRDPTGCYHNPDGLKFDTAEDALAHLKAYRARRLDRALKAVKKDAV
jgi:hypothetical protein